MSLLVPTKQELIGFGIEPTSFAVMHSRRTYKYLTTPVEIPSTSINAGTSGAAINTDIVSQTAAQKETELLKKRRNQSIYTSPTEPSTLKTKLGGD